MLNYDHGTIHWFYQYLNGSSSYYYRDFSIRRIITTENLAVNLPSLRAQLLFVGVIGVMFIVYLRKRKQS